MINFWSYFHYSFYTHTHTTVLNILDQSKPLNSTDLLAKVFEKLDPDLKRANRIFNTRWRITVLKQFFPLKAGGIRTNVKFVFRPCGTAKVLLPYKNKLEQIESFSDLTEKLKNPDSVYSLSEMVNAMAISFFRIAFDQDPDKSEKMQTKFNKAVLNIDLFKGKKMKIIYSFVRLTKMKFSLFFILKLWSFFFQANWSIWKCKTVIPFILFTKLVRLTWCFHWK